MLAMHSLALPVDTEDDRAANVRLPSPQKILYAKRRLYTFLDRALNEEIPYPFTSPPSDESTELLQLPTEIVYLVLQYCDSETLLACRQTCKFLYELVTGASFWRERVVDLIKTRGLNHCWLTKTDEDAFSNQCHVYLKLSKVLPVFNQAKGLLDQLESGETRTPAKMKRIVENIFQKTPGLQCDSPWNTPTKLEIVNKGKHHCCNTKLTHRNPRHCIEARKPN